jgi:crossover junction endodeoxyribonuclease RuvC
MEALTRRTVQSTIAAALPERARILGLDPGSLITGYALVECAGGDIKYLTCGGIRTGGGETPDRLEEIFNGVADVARQWQPDEVAIERVFMHRNADSALKLGQARGAALCGVLIARPAVFEYSPREIKQAVVGTGAAQKEQVQLMVKHLLKLTGALGADAADALAVALCHAHSRRLLGTVTPPKQPRRVRA